MRCPVRTHRTGGNRGKTICRGGSGKADSSVGYCWMKARCWRRWLCRSESGAGKLCTTPWRHRRHQCGQRRRSSRNHGSRVAAGANRRPSRRGVLRIVTRTGEYLRLVDYTGRQIRADKRGVIRHRARRAAARGLSPENWTRQVLAGEIRHSRAIGYDGVRGSEGRKIGQRWLRGITTARRLAA